MNSTRQFLKTALESGMDTGMVAAGDVLRHATPDVLASSLPAAQTAKLLKASLEAAAMDPQLVVDTIGVATLAEHLPTNVLWACLADRAGKALGNTATVADAKPAPAAAAAPKTAAPAKEDASAPVAKPQAKVTPAARAKTKPPPAPGAKNKTTARRSDRRPARLKPRSPTSSDFDVDTDVGEQWPSERGTKGEAESLGAAPLGDDWQKGEETATKNVVDPTATTRKG